MNLYDIIIIGGGVIGSSIARELSRYKLKIALLEKELELGFGVSKANSGIIHPGTQMPPNSLKSKLCVEGNLLIRKISDELGADFKEVGELVVAFNEEERALLEKLKKDGELLGVPNLKIVDRSWIEKNEPNLNPEVIAALFAPSAGIISPYRLVYALSENAKQNNVEIFTETLVESIVQLKPHFEIKTAQGIFYTKFIVNAAGIYADKISEMVGINDFHIIPRKGEEFLLDKKMENITNHIIFPLPSKTSKGILVIKTSDGNPMIGPTAEDVEDREDLSTSDAGFEKVFTSAQRLVPGVNKEDVIAYFAGIRPRAGDDFIVRHEINAPGFVNVAGIQSPGLTAAPAIALMVVNILKDNGLKLHKKKYFKKYRKKSIKIADVSLNKAREIIKKDISYGDIVCRCEIVSSKEIKEAIKHGAKTLDGVKFRTRAQAGRCHGSFCTTRLLKILSEETGIPITSITKKGKGSEIIKFEKK